MELKLAKLPNRAPVKITITVKPALNAALQAYAELYRETYGDSESVADLIPYMLQNFLDSDRTFAKTLRARESDHSPVVSTTLSQTTQPRRRETPKGNPQTSS